MKKWCLFFVLLVVTSAFAQRRGFNFSYWADSLDRLRAEVMTAVDDETRFGLNDDFMNLLERTLNQQDAFKYDWDGIQNFSVLASPDRLFKIFTWFITKEDFTVENFGFIQVYNEARKKYIVYPLFDKRASIDYPRTTVGNHNKWYGAVYYKLVPLKSKARTYYTLLGWNGNDLFTNQKIIEILYFKSDMSPVFGANVFKKYPEKSYRIIFDYAKNSVFTLKYQFQSFDVNTGRRDPRTHKVIYENVAANMIIFDLLAPLDDAMGDVPAFMVPESSVNQGFVEDNGKWLFVNSAKGRNPDKDIPVYKPKNRTFYNPAP